jgi:hypothetical protein
LFKGVIDGAAITTNHVPAFSALVAAIASGHMALPQLKLGRIVSDLTLRLIFIYSTAHVVISSGARNAETAAMKAAGLAQANADRLRVEANLDDARARHRAALEAQAKEHGKGKCEGRRVMTDALERHLANLDIRLGSLRRRNGRPKFWLHPRNLGECGRDRAGAESSCCRSWWWSSPKWPPSPSSVIGLEHKHKLISSSNDRLEDVPAAE